jgi:hypothetical protein
MLILNRMQPIDRCGPRFANEHGVAEISVIGLTAQR